MAETAAFDNSNNRKQSAEGARAKIGENQTILSSISIHKCSRTKCEKARQGSV